MKWIRISLVSLFLLLVTAVALLKSNPAQKFIAKSLQGALAEAGYQVGSVSGLLPIYIHLKNVEVNGAHFDEIEAKINVLYLMKKELRIKLLTARGFNLTEIFQDGVATAVVVNQQANQKLPFTVTIAAFDIQGQFNLAGKARLQENGAGFFSLQVSKPSIPKATLNAELQWDKHRKGEATIFCSTPTLGFFAPFVQIEQECAVEFQMQAGGFIEDCSGEINGWFQHGQEWAFQTHFQQWLGKRMHLDHFFLSNRESQVEGFIDIEHRDGNLKTKADLQATLPQGIIAATLNAEQIPLGIQTQLQWHSPNLKIKEQTLLNLTGSLQGRYANKEFKGNTELKTTWLEEEWTATFPLVLTPDLTVLLQGIQFYSTQGKGIGSFTYQIPQSVCNATLNLTELNLSLINRAIDTTPVLEGVGSGTIQFDVTEIYADFTARDVRCNSAHAQTAIICKSSEELNISVEDFHWKTLQISQATVHFAHNNFHASAVGLLKDPFELHLKGTVHPSQVTLEQLDGTFLSDAISLENPSTLSWAKDSFNCSPLSIQIGNGSVFFEGTQSLTQTDVTFHLNKMPLKNLLLASQNIPISGEINVTSFFREKNGVSLGEVRGEIDHGLIALKGVPESLLLDGKLAVDFAQNQLTVMSNCLVNQRPFFVSNFTLPMTIDPHRLNADIPLDQEIRGTLSMHGKIEEILDFINLGTHRIEGHLDCDLTLTGTLNQPHLLGRCQLSEGLYQNYFTGTQLDQLQGTIRAEGAQLFLENLNAFDGQKGAARASGAMQLSFLEHFPFNGSIEFSELEILQLEQVRAKAQGNISIKGDLNSASLTGQVEIKPCHILIPDTIPNAFPDLHVVYKNAPDRVVAAITSSETNIKASYPLTLNLTVTAPNKITINGRGIHSEWKGNFILQGLITKPVIEGKIELLQGEFLFAGKHFKLHDGSIGLQGNAYAIPIIDISANTAEKGISITARIKGPVNAPQITFQSLPPLPLSSIVSYLLFGKDLSEVNGIQALQLASAIATISGEGPDILEMTRKTLGVDRFQIVTQSTGDSSLFGSGSTVLEIGKVIFPGFMVTLRQGAEEDSTNIRIEVDLTHGFTLGLESQQLPEQGKFSINWNINY